MIEPMSGEFYWVRYGDSAPFIAEYQHDSKDRNGCSSAPAWWVGVTEVMGENIKIVGHIERPLK